MKKITESQLKDKVNSLKEYLKVYENKQVDEWALFDPRTWGNGRGAEGWFQGTSRDDARAQDAAKNTTAGSNMTLVQHREQLAPGSVASEVGSDGVTYAVDAKGQRTFKIENGKWVPMPAPTPAENPELGGAPAQDASAPSQAASVTPKVDPAKVARFKELLAKAGVSANAASATLPKTDMGGGSGLRMPKTESVDYFLTKLRLIESKQLNEALTPEENKELDRLYGELAVDFKDDPEWAQLKSAYDQVPSVSAAAPQEPSAQAATVTPAPEAPAAAPEAPAARPAVPVDPRDGPTGQALAKLGVSKQDRLNQEFVDKTLGAGKYKAGTAEANLALKAYFAKQKGSQAASVTPQDQTKKAPAAVNSTQVQTDDDGNHRITTPDGKSIVVGPDGKPLENGGRIAQVTPKDRAASVTPPATPVRPSQADVRRVDNAIIAKQQAAKTNESVGYNELQRIVSLVNHR